ncbi:zinc finger protein 713 [Hydra vulgaris]|uniref:zinc finger protein 713 n=1 Tax=Hydra vulgaris TaxID=6087 RepID=UPI0006410A5A|nr:zinc finger protein 713 [Hydra vulgaris]
MVVDMDSSFQCFPKECHRKIVLQQNSSDLVTLKQKTGANSCLNQSEKIVINFNDIYSKNDDSLSDKSSPKQVPLECGEEETKERPFVCHVCGRKFRQRCHVDQHLRTHTNVRPYHCSYCAKSFKQKSQINQHERIHTGVKPYKCGMCAQAYPQATQLRYHMKSHVDNVCDKPLTNFEETIKSKRGRPPKSLGDILLI